ncbi:MAG: hypothetical protein FJ102_07875, partial [Deltaproteobacteria bacterium]|nr:hypothetical protein [Deltaproteobacteria bacterium]
MTGATVLAGIGAFGHRVITRIEQSLSDPEGRVQLLARPAPGDVVTGVHQALEALLEAGRYRATSTGQRLDLFLFANAAVLDGDALLETCADLGDLVQAQYGAMFDLRLPPEQRTAALHVVLWTPALTDSPESREVLGRLLRLQSWFERPETRIRGNLLARVWLMPQVGKAGQLKAEGLIASATAFALATVGSGLREQERIRELLRHPPVDAGRFALLTVASLTVPEAAVRDYAIQRAIYDGL